MAASVLRVPHTPDQVLDHDILPAHRRDGAVAIAAAGPAADTTRELSQLVADSTNRRVLIVDDEEAIRSALQRYLKGSGYSVENAASGGAALEILRQRRFALAILDVRMPGMTGLELVPKARALDQDLAIVMLTGVNDAPTATEALAGGACDYLMKPIELTKLQTSVERALHKRMLLIHHRDFSRALREEVALRTTQLETEKSALRDLSVNVIEALVNAMEAKDVYLRGQSQRVAELAASIAEQLGLPAEQVEQVRLAGRLHDVGKIGVRESVANKPAALSPEEFGHIQDHVRVGLEIVSPLKHLGPVLDFIRDHHEHWDGTGYPQGLRGTEISIGGRILAAADAFEALTSERAYRGAMEPAQALDLLRDQLGALLDPEVYDALRSVVGRRRTLTLAFIQ